VSKPLRLWQWLARAGLGRRQQLLDLIGSGAVTVDGQIVSPLLQINSDAEVRLHGELVSLQWQTQVVMYHKPVGIDCNVKPTDPNSIASLLAKLPMGMFPVGRLDKDSCGLLLLCNNGELAQQLMHPDFAHEKEYLVQVGPAPNAAQLNALAAGPSYPYKNQQIHPRACQVEAKTIDSFGITLTEGRYRQIRFMCKAVGLKVIRLQRIRLQQLRLGELAENEWRLLSNEEIAKLTQSIEANSTSKPS